MLAHLPLLSDCNVRFESCRPLCAPVAVGDLSERRGFQAALAEELANFIKRKRGVEGIGEELAL